MGFFHSFQKTGLEAVAEESLGDVSPSSLLQDVLPAPRSADDTAVRSANGGLPLKGFVTRSPAAVLEAEADSTASAYDDEAPRRPRGDDAYWSYRDRKAIGSASVDDSAEPLPAGDARGDEDERPSAEFAPSGRSSDEPIGRGVATGEYGEYSSVADSSSSPIGDALEAAEVEAQFKPFGTRADGNGESLSDSVRDEVESFLAASTEESARAASRDDEVLSQGADNHETEPGTPGREAPLDPEAVAASLESTSPAEGAGDSAPMTEEPPAAPPSTEVRSASAGPVVAGCPPGGAAAIDAKMAGAAAESDDVRCKSAPRGATLADIASSYLEEARIAVVGKTAQIDEFMQQARQHLLQAREAWESARAVAVALDATIGSRNAAATVNNDIIRDLNRELTASLEAGSDLSKGV